MKRLLVCLSTVFLSAASYSVTTNSDSGAGSLRQAIIDMNSGGGVTNSITITISGTSPIVLLSDLPVIQKQATIQSTNPNQIINGGEAYRIFSTYQASLDLSQLNLTSGFAGGGTGGDGSDSGGGGGGGIGAGGGVYVDLGKTLTLNNVQINSCTAHGGSGGNGGSSDGISQGGGGGGASWSIASKNGGGNGGGDYPGNGTNGGGSSEGATGYGGGAGGAGGATTTFSQGITLTGSATIDTNSNVMTLSGAISGSTYGLTKVGAGTLTLSNGSNSYSGATAINVGTRALSGAGSISSSQSVAIAGILDISGVSVSTSINTLSGAGNVSLGTNNLTVTQGSASEFSGTISGSGNLTKSGTAILTLSGASSTYSGITSLTSGQITLGNDSGLGTGQLSMSGGTTLSLANTISASNIISIAAGETGIVNVDNGNSATLSGNIAATTGALTKTGAGTLTLSGVNQYTGATTLSDGILALSAAGSIATSASVGVTGTFDISNITSSATIQNLSGAGIVNLGGKILTVTQGSNGLFSGTITGASGALIKSGASSLTLSGTSDYIGATTVSGGSLIVNGSIISPVTVQSGALVKGTGRINSLTVQSGGSITPGNSIGTISVGTLNLNSGSITNIEFDPSSSSVIAVTGTANIAGTLNLLQDSGSYPSSGSYTFMTFPSGSLTGSFSGITGGLYGYTYSVTPLSDHLLLGYTNILPCTSSVLADGSNYSAILAAVGASQNICLLGSFVVSTSPNIVENSCSLSTDSSGITRTITGSGSPFDFLLRTGPNLVTIDPSVQFSTGIIRLNSGGGIIFESPSSCASSVVIQSEGLTSITFNETVGTFPASITLLGNGVSLISNVNTTISGNITDSNQLIITGAGILTLTGNNSVNNCSLNNGTLSIGSPNNLQTFNLILAGGTLQTTAALSYSPNILVTADSGISSSDAAEFLLLTGNHGITLTLSASGSGSNSFRSVEVSNSDIFTIQGVIGGEGSLTKTGTGTLVLSGSNTYSGGTGIQEGTLSVGSANNLGVGGLTFYGGTLKATGPVSTSVPVNISVDSTISSSDATILSGTLTGLNAITLNLATTGSGTNSLGTVFTDIGDVFTISGVIGGGQTLTKTGSGTLALSGANNYTGGTSIQLGTLSVGSPSNLGTGGLTLGGGTLQTTGAFSSSMAVSVIANSTITSNAATILSGTLTGSPGTTLALNGTGSNSLAAITVPSGVFTVDGIIGGASLLTKAGAGTLSLAQANTYTGGTTINAGTLALSASGGLYFRGAVSINGTSIFDISNAGSSLIGIGSLEAAENSMISLGSKTLQFSLEGDSVIAATITGSGGQLNKFGTGSATLSGSNTFSGGVILYEGQITLTSSTGLGTGLLTANDNTILSIASGIVASNAISLGIGTTINVSSGGDGTLSGVISGSGSLIKTGSNKLILTSENTYSGSTSINVGTLALSGSGALVNSSSVAIGSIAILDISGVTLGTTLNTISGTGNIALGSKALTVAQSTAQTFSGEISGTGSFIKQGYQTLSLTGINLFTGGTTISEGTIALVGYGSLASTGALFLEGTSGFDISGLVESGQIVGDLTTDLGTSIEIAQKQLSFGTGNDTVVAGIIQGVNGTIVKQGSGIVTLSGTNSYSGGTTIEGGALSLSSASNIGGSATSLTFNGGDLVLTDNIAITGNLTVLQSAEIALGSNTLTVSGGGFAEGGDGMTLSSTGLGSLILSNILADSGIFTITAPISGLQALTIQGGETLVLAGINTYSGGTSLLVDTTLRVEGNNPIGTDLLNMADGTTLALAKNVVLENSIAIVDGAAANFFIGSGGDATLSGDITGIGIDFTKVGGGTLIISENTHYTGETTITEGGIVVNGNSPANYKAKTGTQLKGTGIITGLVTVESGGAIYPGNSIGVLSVGQLDLNAGSTTVIEFDPDLSSLIQVSGPATVAGTLQLIQAEGIYAETGNYEIMRSSGLTGAFDAISGGLPGFTFNVVPSGNSLYLHYQYGGVPPAPPHVYAINTDGLTGNILAFANYLNEYAPLSDEFIALTNLSGTALSNGVNSASPARIAFGIFVTQQTLFTVSQAVNGHMGTKRFLHSIQPTGEEGIALSHKMKHLLADTGLSCLLDSEIEDESKLYEVWITGLGQFAHQVSENQNAPFNFISEGLLGGLDYTYSENTIVGASFGYAHSQIHDGRDMGKSNIPYYYLAFYGCFSINQFYLETSFLTAYHRIHNERYIVYPGVDVKAVGTTSGWQIDPHVALGYYFDTSWTSIEPFATLDFAANWESKMQEKGAGSLNITQKAHNSSMLQSQSGVRFYQSLCPSENLLGFKESISYINRVPFGTGTITSTITGAPTSITLQSLTKVQNLAVIDLEIFALVGKSSDALISISYNGQFGANYISNEILFKLGKRY